MSVHAHLSGHDNLDIVKADRLLDLVDDWKEYLRQAKDNKISQLQKHTRTGRVLDDGELVHKAEILLKCKLRKIKLESKKKK